MGVREETGDVEDDSEAGLGRRRHAVSACLTTLGSF
jgi:hypothetical protein